MGSDSPLVYFNSSLSASSSTQGNRTVVSRVNTLPNNLIHGDLLEDDDGTTGNICVHSSGGICAPIVDFETVERKQTFTVYRIHVVTLGKNWYIFRRYTDFTRLNDKLLRQFPGFTAKLPAKRWFGNNYDPAFLRERKRALQMYINNLMRHDLIARSKPLKEFLCLDDPPGPYDSIEESRAFCDEMEQTAMRDRHRAGELEAELHATKSRLAQAQIQQEVLAAALKAERIKNSRLKQSSANSNHSKSVIRALKEDDHSLSVDSNASGS